MHFSEQTLKLSDSIGTFIEYWGFKKIHGRIWCLLFLSKEPLPTKVLIESLDVSKGLVSTAIATLVKYRLIREIDTDNKKVKVYQANLKLSPIISYVLKNREQVILNQMKTNYDESCKVQDINVDQKRLKRLGKYINVGSTLLNGVMRFSKIDMTEWRKWED